MAEPVGIMCLLKGDGDPADCPAVAAIDTGLDDCAVLVCALDEGHDGDLHHDLLEGIWWRADEGRDD